MDKLLLRNKEHDTLFFGWTIFSPLVPCYHDQLYIMSMQSLPSSYFLVFARGSFIEVP